MATEQDGHITIEPTVTRNIIRLTDGRESPTYHCVRKVSVNGVDLRLAEDGIDIEYGPEQVTIVTLRVIASEIPSVLVRLQRLT